MKFLSQINVNTEYTLPIVDGTNGQVLTTDGNGAVYWGSIAAGVTTLDGLTDVILTSPSSGQLLRYGIPPGSGETFPVWYNFTPNYLTPSSSIDNLGDVTITSAASGQVLQWNGTAWVNATLSTVDYVSKVQHTVKAGVAITKGQAVYITTSDGTNMIAGLASNAAEATSSKVIGLAASSAAINDQIFVVTEGLIAGLNTSTATAGDPVWLGTNGNLIFGLANKPVAPAHLVYIGVVTRVQSNNGEIFVNVQNGFELNEIHDALIVSPTAGQLLRRDSDNLWKNWTPNFLTDEADTLATVTARGATTTSNITVNGAAFATSFSATSLLIANADTSGSLQPDQGSPANKIYSFRWAGNEQGYIDTDAKITFAGFKTPTGTASQFLKANGTVDSNVYITSAALSGYATQAWVNSNFYTQGQIDDFFGGAEPISGYNKSNWDTAYNDKINSASFNTTNGILTLTQQDGGTVTVDLDGRYLTSDTDAQTLTWEAPTKNLSITNGNTVTLEGLATEDYVLSQGFISSESDTLATVTGRGNSTTGRINVRGIGNQGGGNIMMGNTGDGTNKWSYLTGTHYNADSQPQGFSLIGGLSTDSYNAVIIGGNIYESNPATQIQFWTHTATTHNLGGTQRGVIDSSGNWGVGTTNPQYRLDVAGGNVRLSQGYESVRIHGVDLLGYSSGNLWQIGNTTYSSLVLSTSWDWDRQVEFNYTPNTTGQVAGVLRIGQMQKNSATWTHGRTEFYVNGSVRSNINTYGVGIGREAASNQKLAIDAATGTWILDAYNSGTEIGGIHVNSGILTLQGSGSTEVRLATSGNATWNGDVLATRTWVQAQGYLTSETDSQDLTWDPGSKTLGITNGNSVVLENLATEDYVTSQGYVTSSHTHSISQISGLQAAIDSKQNASTAVELFDYLWTNPVFGQYGIKSNLVDNILYSAQQRFTVLKNGGAYGGDLFNANYDQWQDIIPAGQSTTYTIQFNTKNNPSYGIVYPWGKIYLSFYYTQIPASVVGRSKDQNGVWSNLSGWTNVANNGSYAVWSADINGSNYLVELEITITASSGVDTWFAQWEYVLGRPGQFENGIVSKFQDNSIWRTLFFKDSNNNNRVTIGSGGISTDQSITVNGTSSLYFGSYGGGFYMQDGTWIRTVGNRSIWVNDGYLGGQAGLTIGYGGTPPSQYGGAIIASNVGIGTTSPSEKLHVSGAAIFDGGAANSSTDAVVYVTKSNNNDWGLYVNASGLDYGMYTRVSPSAGYAFAIHNGTTWTTRITGDGRLHLNQKDTIASYDSWLRLNQSGEYGSGVYTPYALRNDGPFDNYGGIYGYSTIRARKAQTAGSYASAALWTESYDATTTGIAFHISGNVGKFLEMRTDGILYWNGDAVLHSGNIGSYAWNSSNDGSGSGLDADLLDGQQGSYYQAAATAITTANIGSQSVAYAGEAGFVSNQGGQLLRFDNRTISPSETSAGYLQFGFTSWTNNNGAPYADYLHMRSYTDASGGSDNLIMFKKSGIGMRIWQQTFGSSTAYSSYADVWTTDNFSSTDVSNWNAAYNDKVNSASFNTTNGVLTLTQQDGGTVTVDLDGRYLTSDTDAQTLTWDAGSKTLGITNGNDVILSELATEDFVTSQGYLTSLPSHNHDDRYYTESESDNRFVRKDTTGQYLKPYNEYTSSLPASSVASSIVSQMGGGGLRVDFMSNASFGSWAHAISFSGYNGYNMYQLAGHYKGSGGEGPDLYVRCEPNHSQNSWSSWEKLWHTGNDGSGSGLDADLLDGNHASAFYLATNPSGYITGSYLDDYTRGAYRVISDYGSNTTWYIRSNGQFVFGTGHDWTASFRLNIDNGSGYGSNGSWAYFGQQDSNATNGTWRGVRIRKFAGGSAVDGDLSAGAYYIGTTRKDTNWDAAYTWGNHADAPYWNVSLTDAVQVEAQEVIFAGNVTIQGTLTESSSIRFKENIAPLEPSLDKVNQLEAVSYNKIGEDNREIGLIAEDVAELFPEVVTYNEEGQPQGIQYQRLSVILLKAVQELTERVNKLENK